MSSANPDPLDEERYKSWVEQGHAAELSYMSRVIPRRWMPQDLLVDVKSVITFGVNFFSGAKKMEPRFGFGRVARYAWGKDYHIVLKKRLEAWVKLLQENIMGELHYKILVDSSPFLERSFARRGGLGFVGKNTLLISRKLGSFIFLCEVLTNLELESDEIKVLSSISTKDECGSCKECLVECPTGALVNSRNLDARKCISYWTIEYRGEIPENFRPSIGDWIFGCDICQDVCPYTGLSKETQWKEFLPESGASPYLSLLEVLQIESEEKFKKRFEGSPILRAKRSGLVRNSCIVSANQKFKEAVPYLEKIAKEDPDPMLQTHALWALNQF
ncbi:MAG: tRNA epoxyqueuosine(34) reductase QueG [Elusimicrobia bacterium RIFCSPLOWO2_02_FULL_39_32]|nr:MAG: tRNA epoxyqueuosine(34) reductase QueG [Elusimicrobia bacterium GWA2_38_7]OGR80384.1 MAG: tRNA epoxyqueuosine(34) reductase QueG [Elusimicrobia bacterium RIFCSPHIGHO2_02_FULL_39_36]OGR93681.1 MAG: tRNA epoxyqueuosine(34) reductase QueG [Elusimicrobia bacterium RIFCSPLOWO2_02_FULL_39_32]OGS00502.1 MAG: tRNA epoxyqueuosine(34) reductase QueG [Elusimicrobia bacterium RIFCSPLOWO2_12_FULL_39_28]